jgi:hypothetical protein
VVWEESKSRKGSDVIDRLRLQVEEDLRRLEDVGRYL